MGFTHTQNRPTPNENDVSLLKIQIFRNWKSTFFLYCFPELLYSFRVHGAAHFATLRSTPLTLSKTEPHPTKRAFAKDAKTRPHDRERVNVARKTPAIHRPGNAKKDLCKSFSWYVFSKLYKLFIPFLGTWNKRPLDRGLSLALHEAG